MWYKYKDKAAELGYGRRHVFEKLLFPTLIANETWDGEQSTMKP